MSATSRTVSIKDTLAENPLTIVFGLLLLGCLAGQLVVGLAGYNEAATSAGLAEIDLLRYVTSSSFAVDVAENWQSEYLQNWQSEMLAVGSMAIFAVFLRQRGSAESKPVGAPHDQTGSGDGGS